MMRGWALTERDQVDAGVAELRRALDACRAVGADSGMPQYLALTAEAEARAGRIDAALEAIREGLEIAGRTEERWWEADLHRLRGELLLAASGTPADAEACFQRAIEVAREVRARLLELRATTSLARLWRRDGRTAEARRILAAIVDGFGAGRNTRDLDEAAALLEELS
jgi:adenylate cyclase